ncbi:hypothetical protein [Edaphobacter flagellatus]|uniref:hypothetical protein n=1 Tax=Edaphobacter flagellatus TaxID=1933044 RepID=UPI0021B2D9FC|nr:hypothetical protein [Edaphobacter flagellatus]
MLLHRLYARKVTLGALSALAVVLTLTPAAFGQDALIEGLKQKYRISEINAQGVVANPGTVLTIEADGINAEPYPTMITFENPVVDGQVKQRSKGLGFLKSNNLQILQPGQKVYITKINESTSGQEDSLKITILTSDAILARFSSGAYSSYQTAKRYSTTLAFKLPKGSLSGMSVDSASKMIEAVLSFNPADQVRTHDAGVVTRSCEPHCAISATTGAPVGTPSSAFAPPPPASAPTIALGQTPDQVTSILGTPKQIVDLGSKKIYKYPDMKVVFTDGKVSDVQ